MRSKHDKAQAVTRAEAETTRAIGHVQRRLGLDGLTEQDAARLSARLAGELAALPRDERRMMRRDIAVAAHELEGLVSALEAELGLLADELRTLGQRTAAARAYGHGGSVVPLRQS